MHEKRREFYRSANGDAWFLCRDRGRRVYVEHEPNEPSGGKASRVDVAVFLAGGIKGPEHQALIELLGSLVDADDASTPGSRIA
jgi:hypothetical protein